MKKEKDFDPDKINVIIIAGCIVGIIACLIILIFMPL